MGHLTHTQKRILEVGRKEFLSKGYQGASLRGIVKEAGFTQGAFYGYYPDKAALFEALVAPAANGLIDQFKAAQAVHFDLIPEGKTASSRELSTEYLRHFMGYIYDNFEAFKLIVCCSDGTKYVSYVHDLVELEVEQAERYFALLKAQGKAEGRVSRAVHHLITSAYFTAVFETVVHDMPREKAFGYIEELSTFFDCGWDGLLKLT
jgi:AcrR family transcriptional regulator